MINITETNTYYNTQNKIEINGMTLINGTYQEMADWILDGTASRNIAHINLYNFFLITKNRNIRKDIIKNFYLLLDGIGLALGAILLGLGKVNYLNGTDLFPFMMQKSIEKELKVFLLGGRKEIIIRTVNNLKIQYPELNIVGYHDGYFTESEEELVITEIIRTNCDLLIVGMGCPLQERCIIKIRKHFASGVCWAVGGLFDFISGLKPRAPLWIRKINLEWLFRFLLEPSRMWFRNYIVGPWFFLFIIHIRCKKLFLNLLKR